MAAGGDGYPNFFSSGSHAGDHGPDPGRLRDGELADLANDPGPDHVHRSEPGRRKQLPGRISIAIA